MKTAARFEKISKERFLTDVKALFSDMSADGILSAYDGIRLPERATAGSAGYDFFLPLPISLAPGSTVVVPTGIRAYIEEGWFLMCCPRSGLGFKFRLRLDNTIGIIDSDYYNAANEGHIMIKLTNESFENKTLSLDKGAAFAQGIFIPFGTVCDDNAANIRCGGFGSTSDNM